MVIREADRADRRAVAALIRRARWRTPDLWRWERYLASRGFVITEVRGRVEGALLASMDASPVAWVQLAAVGECLEVGEWLARSLPPVAAHAAAEGADRLAWMDYQGWAASALAEHGFRPTIRVVTLSKTDRARPRVEAPSLRLRPASSADYARVARIDRRAFKPIWWRSEGSVRERAARASQFTLAELEGRVVGYVEWEGRLSAGHVNRLAVDPRCQGKGIGPALLSWSLEALWDRGADGVSLNTQASNHRSRRLYDRFNFKPTGDSVIVWSLPLKGCPNSREDASGLGGTRSKNGVSRG